ncbi:MAG: hypothetical protein ACK5H1_07635 [Tenacibaculum sp.]
MKKILLILTLSSFYASSQIDKYSVMGMPIAVDDAEMNSVTDANEGSMVYNVAKKTIFIHNGSNWDPVHKHEYGDIKHGIQAGDHSGWYIVNGRDVSSLPANAKINAEALGFIANLPDAKNRVLKHPDIGQTIGNTGGNTTTTLTNANLPNVDFTGSTNVAGSHIHNYSFRKHFNYEGNVPPITGGSVDYSIGGYDDFAINTTLDSGNHDHSVTVNSGGTSQPFERYPPYLIVNTFIYLGL